MNFSVPLEVRNVSKGLRDAGFGAYLVGGCVRDLLIGRSPKDWDVTTEAKPEDIQRIFADSFYTNEFGTVGVKTGSHDPSLSIIEVTPYRTEGTYTDKRRPDHVAFGDSLEDDLARRDFTINAIAYDDSIGQIVDPYRGQTDIEARVLRTVREPEDRFEEDALRLMRAVRLVAELEFALDTDTAAAIKEKAQNLRHISKERIRDEFARILNSSQPMMALVLCQKLGLLEFIAPDLLRGIGIDQNQAHSYTVFEHNLRALQHAADKGWDFEIRLAAVFHDISKPETRKWSNQKNDWTFYGHEVVGSRVTRKALEELRFSRETIEKVSKLVRWHMFFSDPDQISLSAVRRMIRNVGEENIWDLLNLRICDRIGTGRPKEQPFRFRKYKAMVEEALRDPLSVKMLKIDGSELMKVHGIPPGPRIGWALHALLEEVLESPEKNTNEYLAERSKSLLMLEDSELRNLGEGGKEKRDKLEEEEINIIQEKYHVK